MKKVLVTTSIEETRPDDKPILLLGEWCNKLGTKNESTNSQMSEDIFIQTKNNSVKYLEDLINRILIPLSKKLNEIHNANYSPLFWKRLLSRWLRDFIHSQHYHWYLIKHIEKSYSIEKTYVIKEFEELLHCKNNMIVQDVNLWLHASFAYIIKNYSKIPCELIDYSLTKKNTKLSRLSRQDKILIFLSKIAHRLKLIKNKDILFLNSSMSGVSQIITEILCKQFPLSWLHNSYQNINTEDNPSNINYRNWSLRIDANNDFERFIEKVISARIPRDCLENFADIGHVANQLPFQKFPKNIIIGDWPKSRSVILRLITETLEKSPSTKLLLMQHGGNHGMDEYENEKYDIALCDIYLSWGWGKKLTKVVPLFYHKRQHKPSLKGSNDRLTLVSLDIHAMPITYHSISPTIYKNFLEEDLKLFITNIDEKLIQSIWLRGFKNHSGIYDFYSEKFKEINIDDSYGKRDSIKKLIQSTKLFVITYNSTIVQEIMLSNSPVVLFWRSDLFPIKKEYEYCFNQMNDAGLFHNCPESAAKHISSIWNNIDEWWNKHTTQAARKLFCENFAKSPVNLKKLANIVNQ